ncbi:unnamed protein product [Schistosoma turkestanicum]|nr:unnamed protein product [Schistosoma turkestanicum]
MRIIQSTTTNTTTTTTTGSSSSNQPDALLINLLNQLTSYRCIVLQNPIHHFIYLPPCISIPSYANVNDMYHRLNLMKHNENNYASKLTTKIEIDLFN